MGMQALELGLSSKSKPRGSWVEGLDLPNVAIEA